MADKKWTDEQKLAFTTRDRTLLISAAAGSGKTATLTERIIRSILDEKARGDIGKMLIVTFTNAAVNELRERISAAIRDAALANKNDARLEEQLLRVKDAKIITINSFCNDVLRSCAERVGLTPSYRIAEPAEAALIAKSILEGMIGAAYEGELTEVCSPEEFSTLAEGLTSVKGEGALSEVFTLIYDKLSSEFGGLNLLLNLVEEYNPEKYITPDTSPLVDYAKERLYEMLRSFLQRLEYFKRELELDGLSQKTVDVFDKDIELLKLTEAKKTYEEIHSIMSNAEFADMQNSKNPIYPEAKKTRDSFVEAYKSYYDKFFSLTPDDFRILYTKLYKSTSIIYKFIKKYDEVFLGEKKRRGIVEFRDAERYACEALWTDEKTPSPLALEISSKYTDVYIDEYQDVNALQGRVFEAISRPDNCFMVGDIKQSIYGFRSAKPDFFAGKKNTYPKLGEAGDFPKASLFMSKNFRCDRGIIDFTNDIFDTLFGTLGKSISYVNEDRLEFAKVYGEGQVPTGHVPEIHLIENKRKSGIKKPTGLSDTPLADEIEKEELSAIEKSAEAVAEKIASLVGVERLANGKLIRPCDVAIIMRSVKYAERIYCDALSRRGISAEIKAGRDFFLNEEVLLATSLLSAIDNPRRDVQLAAVMMSPLYGFTANELLLMKKKTDCETLYEALIEYVGKYPDYEKGRSFLSALKRYRRLSSGMSVDNLISLLYRETGLLSLASVSGGKENLLLLHNHARKYEESSFRGLHSFVAYVAGIIESDGEIETPEESSEDENKVKIITSHRSKGLEFPVCFIAETQKSTHINERGAAARIKLAADFGFSVGVRDDTGLAMFKNPISAIIDLYAKEKEHEEALRVLYVALTRARERLYVYGSTPDIDNLKMRVALTREYPSVYSMKTLGSMLDMILVCFKSGRLNYHYEDEASAKSEDTVKSDGESEQKQAKSTDPCTEKSISVNLPDAMKQELLRRFDFKYSKPHLLGLPEKLSVSTLSPTVLDGNEAEAGSSLIFDLDVLLSRSERSEEAEKESTNNREDLLITQGESEAPVASRTLPSFFSGDKSDESARDGIATHTFMQFFNLERLECFGVTEELNALTRDEFISPADAERVRKSEIEKFRSSALFSRMKNARKLYRELRFNVKLPAADFTKDEKKRAALKKTEILVQGVIDCIIEDSEGNLHLVDYKTDRLTKAELNDKALAGKKLIPRHKLQLSYYREAIAKMFGKPPKTVSIYSLHLGDEIEL